MTRFGKDFRAVTRAKPATFNAPLKKLKGPLVFTCSWSDFFIEDADEWRDVAWGIIRLTPHLTYQILTKRPENIQARLPVDWGNGWPNVWLGVSAEDQKRAEQRIPLLLQVPAYLHWVSYEPALGPIDMEKWLLSCKDCGNKGSSAYAHEEPGTSLCLDACIKHGEGPALDWIICGGESGAKAKVRRSEADWFRAVRDDCRKAGVPFFLKQITVEGQQLPYARWQPDLQIRQFPAIANELPH